MKKTDTLKKLRSELEYKIIERGSIKNPFSKWENLKECKYLCDRMNEIMDEIEGKAPKLSGKIAHVISPAFVFLSVIFI